MLAADFFTTEVWTVRGLVTYYTLFVIELHSRRVSIVGSTPHPDEAFVRQVVRQLTAADEGVLDGHRGAVCSDILQFFARGLVIHRQRGRWGADSDLGRRVPRVLVVRTGSSLFTYGPRLEAEGPQIAGAVSSAVVLRQNQRTARSDGRMIGAAGGI